MQKLAFEFSSKLVFSQAVTDHAFLLRCLPRQTAGQKLLSHELALEPEGAAWSKGADAFGNATASGRLSRPHKEFSYKSKGVVLRDDAAREPAPCLPCYRYPSKLTLPSEEMAEFLQTLGLAGQPREKAAQISAAVHGLFSYENGATDVNTTAAAAFRRRRGVCQDYAHVFLALARLAGIPARYVCGLPEGSGATHAWAEIWQEGLWQGFDPTRACPAGEGYISLAVGRDYGDCPTERGVFQGNVGQTQTSFMQVAKQ